MTNNTTIRDELMIAAPVVRGELRAATVRTTQHRASVKETIGAVSAITTHYERTKVATPRARRHVSVARRLIASMEAAQ